MDIGDFEFLSHLGFRAGYFGTSLNTVYSYSSIISFNEYGGSTEWILPHNVDLYDKDPEHTFAVVSQIEAATNGLVSADNPTFSNAVLAVGLNIDTNSVAVLNEIAATFGDFPITGTATTVGGLLAALAAAVAWLRKNKIDKLKVTGMTAEATAENGVAKLDDFFKESNSLLGATIEAKVNSMFDNGDTTAYPRTTEG